MLAVVEHDQRLAVRQVGQQHRLEVGTVALHVDGRCECAEYEIRIGDRCKIDEEDAVGIPVRVADGDLHREAGLPRAPDTGEGDVSARRQQRQHVGDVLPTPDEQCPRRRKVDDNITRPRHGEVRWKVWMAGLEELDGLRDVLQAVATEAAERDAFGAHVGREVAYERGDEQLSTVRGGGDARRFVHRHPDNIALGPSDLAGVQAHAHAKLDAFRPLVRVQGELRVDGSSQAFAGGVEHEEEAIAVGCVLLSAVCEHGTSNDVAVCREHDGVRVTERREQPS
ncbi:MAG: hypothetical protein QOC92_4853 [Acidimicrobiaceae bacterium]|jgi:hypothetical protein